MGKSLTEVDSRESGKRETEKIFNYLHKENETNVVIDGRKNKGKHFFG